VGAALRACSPASLCALDLSGCLELTDGGLAAVAGFMDLEELVLHNCMKIGDAAVEAVSQLSSLRTLNLRGCSQLGDHHIAALCKGLSGLHDLSLQSCNGLTGTCLPALARGAPALAALNLSHCMRLDERHLEHLAALPGLRRLDLTGCQAPAASGIGRLAGLSALSVLRAAGWTQRPALPRQQAARRRQQQQHQAVAAQQGLLRSSASDGQLAALVALGLDVGAPSGWELPPQVARVDMRGATLTHSALQSLLRGLPDQLQSLDLSQCHILPGDGQSGWVDNNSSGRGGHNSSSGGGGVVDGVDTQQEHAPAAGAGNGHAGAHGGDLAAAAFQAAAQQQPVRLSVADLQSLSQLTALTALSISGVAPAAVNVAEKKGGVEASSSGSQPCAICSGSASSAGSTCSCTAAASWPPGTLQALGRLGSPWLEVVGGKATGQRSSNSSTNNGRPPMRAAGVRRVLDLDAWATCDPAPLQLSSSQLHAQPRLFGSQSSSNDDGMDEEDGSLGGFGGLGWAHGGEGGSCSGSSGWAAAAEGGTPVVLTFSEAGSPGSGRGGSGAVVNDGFGCWSRALAISSSSGSSSGMATRGVAAAAAAGSLHWNAMMGRWQQQQQQQEQQHEEQRKQKQQQQKVHGPTHEGITLALPPATWLSPLCLLQRLALTQSSWVHDGVVASFASLTALRRLDVSGCRELTGAGFAALSPLTALSELLCAGCAALDDGGARAIVGAVGCSLKRLDLSGCEAVGDAGAAYLGAVTGLNTLSLAANRTIGAR